MATTRRNKFWAAQSTKAPRPLPQTPDELWNAACEYFDWVEKNPLYELKMYTYQGNVIEKNVPKMRAMSVTGMCLFLGITQQVYLEFKDKKGFSDICTQIENAIKTRNFEGAAAELLNPSVIAKDLNAAPKPAESNDSGAPELNIKVEFGE